MADPNATSVTVDGHRVWEKRWHVCEHEVALHHYMNTHVRSQELVSEGNGCIRMDRWHGDILLNDVTSWPQV